MILQNNSSISLFHKISSAIDNVILLDFRYKFLSILGLSGKTFLVFILSLLNMEASRCISLNQNNS